MTRVIEWLLGLEGIRLGRDAPLLVKWDHPVAAWLVFCMGLAALTWIALVYHRERAPLRWRVAPGLLRYGTLALVGVVIGRPSLVLQRNRVEAAHVVLALDTSASMAGVDLLVDKRMAQAIRRVTGAPDGPPPSGESASVVPPIPSRLDLVKSALLQERGAALDALLQHNDVRLCSFARRLEERGYFTRDGDSTRIDALQRAIETLRPDGDSTDLGGAIRTIIEGSQGRRLAAVVLVTDGQATQPARFDDVLAAARGQRIPIYAVRIGSTHRPVDVEVGAVRAHRSVFVNDFLAVEAALSSRGFSQPAPVEVQLVDERSGETVDRRSVTLDPTPAAAPQRIELRARPTRTGAVSYRVEAVPLPDETLIENNVARVEVTVLSDHLRVLYVDGTPRYEYRYLKNALMREATMELSVLLMEADEAFVQEGTDPIRRFPQSPDELNRYDVVLLGDVDPRGGWLTLEQMKMLVDFVGREGGGFGLIAGPRAAPHRYLGTPLEKLIPIRIDPAFSGSYDAALTGGFRPRLTHEGRRSRVFRLDDDPAASDQILARLPELFWYARTLGPQPGASVLAEHPTARTAAGAMPIVVTGRYGAGKLFFQATDDTWRWRRHTGELLHDTYWVQVVRSLMRGSRAGQGRRLLLRTDRRVYDYGDPVHIQVEVFDAGLLFEQGETIDLAVMGRLPKSDEPAGGAAFPAPETDAEHPAGEALVARVKVHRIGEREGRWEGSWIPPRVGSYALRFADMSAAVGQPAAAAAAARIRVEGPRLEARRPQADHQILARIAAATGGRVLELDELPAALSEIADRSLAIPDDLTESLWDSKLVFALFALMISMEWILRKLMGLL